MESRESTPVGREMCCYRVTVRRNSQVESRESTPYGEKKNGQGNTLGAICPDKHKERTERTYEN